MSFLTDNAREPEYSEEQLKSTFIPIQNRKPRYTNQNSTTGLPNFGMSPWNMVQSVLTSLGITSAAMPSVMWGRILVVSDQVGDDASGTRNDIASPFKTIGAALLQAASLDTIIVMPGNYTETTLVKPNVSLFCMPGTQITVTKFEATTLTLGGRHGIYGYGQFTFLTDTIQDEIISTVAFTEFTFEADLLIVSKVSLIWNTTKVLNFHVKRLLTAEAGAFCLAKPSANSTTNVTIDKIEDSNGPSKVITINELGVNSVLNLHIIYAEIQRMNIVNGLIYTSGGNITAAVNIRVDKFRYTSPQSAEESKAPVISDANCLATKNYVINNIDTTGYLYRPAISVVGSGERGTIELQGKVRTYAPGTVLNTFIDFSKQFQQVRFVLDIEDTTTETLTNDIGILNISSASGGQSVTGRIKTTRNLGTTPGVIMYGTMPDLTPSTATVTLEYFTVAIVGNAPSFRFNGAGLADMPCKTVYATQAASADNGGIVVVIDPSITVSTSVV